MKHAKYAGNALMHFRPLFASRFLARSIQLARVISRVGKIGAGKVVTLKNGVLALLILPSNPSDVRIISNPRNQFKSEP